MKLNDKTDLAVLRIAIAAALAKVGEEHGIAFEIGNMSYTPTGSEVRVGLTARDPNRADAQNEAEWRRLCGWGQFRPEDLGAEIRVGGDAFVIAGYKPTARKSPIRLTRKKDGKPFVVAEDVALRALGRKVEA